MSSRAPSHPSDRAGAVAARTRRARERRGDPPRLEGARGAHPPRPKRRARGCGHARHGRVQPGARAVRVVARGGRAVAQADAARGAARAPSRSASCARRAHAGAEPLVVPRRRPRRRASCPAAIPPGARAHGPRPGTGRGRAGRARRWLLRRARRARPVAYGCPVCGQLQRAGGRAPRAAPVSRVPRGARAARALGARGRAALCAASARAPAPAARPRPSSATPGSRSSRASASAGPSRVGRRPREERRGKMLAAYAHAYALWAAGSTARDADGVRAASS